MPPLKANSLDAPGNGTQCRWTTKNYFFSMLTR